MDYSNSPQQLRKLTLFRTLSEAEGLRMIKIKHELRALVIVDIHRILVFCVVLLLIRNISNNYQIEKWIWMNNPGICLEM